MRCIPEHLYYYDLAGNLVTSVVNGATTVFRYNAQNKLARIAGQGFSYDFLYDSQNRRIASRRNSGDWRFDVHDSAVCLASVTSGTMERFFVRGVGITEGTGDVLAEIRGSDANSATAVFYVVNHRGDTLNAYVSGIGLIASYRYDAFGNVIEFSCAAGHTNLLPRYTFSTKEYLPDAKVYLYAYRVYDPIAGRWTQRDPIDYQDSVNLYCFSKNNAINECDPDGQFAVPLLIGLTVGGLLALILYTYSETVEEIGNKATQKICEGKPAEQEFENMQKATEATCLTTSSVLLGLDAMIAIGSSKAIPDNTGSPAKGPLKYNSAAGRYQTTQPVPGKPGQPFVSNRAGDTYMNNLAQGVKPNGGTTALPAEGAKQGAAAAAPTLFEKGMNRRSR